MTRNHCRNRQAEGPGARNHRGSRRTTPTPSRPDTPPHHHIARITNLSPTAPNPYPGPEAESQKTHATRKRCRRRQAEAAGARNHRGARRTTPTPPKRDTRPHHHIARITNPPSTARSSRLGPEAQKTRVTPNCGRRRVEVARMWSHRFVRMIGHPVHDSPRVFGSVCGNRGGGGRPESVRSGWRCSLSGSRLRGRRWGVRSGRIPRPGWLWRS